MTHFNSEQIKRIHEANRRFVEKLKASGNNGITIDGDSSGKIETMRRIIKNPEEFMESVCRDLVPFKSF